MTSISIKWKPLVERLDEAARLAMENSATHFRFAERNTILLLGTKEELKFAGKGIIYSALPYDPMDPETWEARWMPSCSAYDGSKDLKMWSDEYEALKQGISFKKGGFKS